MKRIAGIIATVNKSFLTCRSYLSNIISKLVTPKPKSKHKHRIKQKGFHNLNRIQIETKNKVVKLPPSEKMTVFLDLDETLIYSSSDPRATYDFIVRPNIDGKIMTFFVLIRPGVDKFLQILSTKFEIVIFTAAVKEYATLVLDQLDTKRLISHRLYRDSCSEVGGKYIKDLSKLGRDLRKVVLVDDNPTAYEFQPKNAIRIKPFVDDLSDRELWKLIHFFQNCDGFDDLRDAVKTFTNEEPNYNTDDI